MVAMNDPGSVFASIGFLVALGTAGYVYGLIVLPPRRTTKGPDANASGAGLANVSQPPNQTPASGQPTSTQR
jgi:hypothetical protein